MPESNMSLPASAIDKAVLIGALETALISGEDFISFYDTSATGEAKQRKISWETLLNLIREYFGGLPIPTSEDVGKAIIAGSNGAYQFGPVISGASENFVILPSEWQPLSDSEPFQYYVEKTAIAQISLNSTVELINNDPVNFAKYGLAIDSVNNRTIRFMACIQPLASLAMRVMIYG